MVDGEQIYGDGVNVAARLESLADPGGICISGTVHEQVRDKLALGYEDAGEQEVKNIVRPVRVFRVLPEPGAAAPRRIRRVARKYLRRGIFSIAGLAMIAAAIVFVQHLSLRPLTTTASIPPAQKPALPLPNIPSIAVLPFTNLSGDPQQEYFSDGVTGELITHLSRLPSLFVIASTSSFAYKGKSIKLQDVARQLGVKYVLEGTVNKAGDQVRVTARLADATTGAELWAEDYDRPLGNIFSLQDEIVGRIATTMNLQLSLLENGTRIRISRRTDNLEAYDNLLRAMAYWVAGTKDGDEKARRALNKAIALDPKYADAYAWLGFIYFSDFNNQWDRDPHLLDRIFQTAQQAVALDDSNSLAYSMLSVAYLFAKRDYDQGIAAAQHAIAIDPNFALGYGCLAWMLEVSGRPAEAVEAAEKAIRLDPINRARYLLFEGFGYAFMGRYGDAIPRLKEHLARYPNGIGARIVLIACYIELGRTGEARAEAAEVMRINPGFSLEMQRKNSVMKEPMRDRLFGDMTKAGLK
jgi:adenylate cyclase